MSAENALSGRGLENLFQAICRLERIAVPAVGAADISALALEGAHRQANEAVDLFLKLLARVAGDMAILTLARGGVFIAGGIGQKLAARIRQPEFRREFEDKAPHGAIMATVPLFVMTHPTAALEGLSACVRRPAMFSLEGASRRFEADP